MPSNPSSIRSRVFPTAHRLLLERRIRRELPRVTGEVLVLGAGHDPYAHYLSSANSVVTTDIDADSGNIDYVADAHDLPFGSDTFDCVVAIEVFEHLAAPGIAAKELLRVLKKGGRGVISTPFLFHVHGDPFDFNRFTASGFRELFSGATSIETYEIGGRVHVISDIITTVAPPFAALRIINHVFRLKILGLTASLDCPSGYWVDIIK